MSLHCPECHVSPAHTWLDWDDNVIVQLQYSSRMAQLLGTLEGVTKRHMQRLNYEQSMAVLCQCPLCHKLVIYLKSEVPISDRTGDTLHHVVKVNDVAIRQMRPVT